MTANKEFFKDGPSLICLYSRFYSLMKNNSKIYHNYITSLYNKSLYINTLNRVIGVGWGHGTCGGS